jgi:hypothetical protein
MSGYNRQQYEQAIQKLQSLGLHRSDIQDYYKIPTNNLNLENVESVHPTKGDKNDLAMEVLVIDSRERNYNLYPFPHEYQIETGIYIKNVKSIELTALTIPKTEYNVQDENKHIPWGFMSSPSVNYTSVITPGQYTSIGLQNINSTTPNGEIILNQPFVWGLLKEVEDQLNAKDPIGGNHFIVTLETKSSDGANTSIGTRVMIRRDDNVPFFIDFTKEVNFNTLYRMLGFSRQRYESKPISELGIYSATLTQYLNKTLNSSTDQAIIADWDWTLYDDPKYLVMELDFNGNTADRLTQGDGYANGKFATVFYDSNDPDVINQNPIPDSSGKVSVGSQKLNGRLKALKGQDFDKKIYTFDPPIDIQSVYVKFWKWTKGVGSIEKPYDFKNREHVLIFYVHYDSTNPNQPA